MKDLAKGALGSLPAVVEAAHGVKIAVAESDVVDYPGLWLAGTGGTALAATFPPTRSRRRRSATGTSRSCAAPTTSRRRAGRAPIPWRILGIAEKDARPADELARLPAGAARPRSPTRRGSSRARWPGTGGTRWNIHGVTFKSGVNTETYQYYIDFAAQHGIEYVILDEGWYELGDLRRWCRSSTWRSSLRYAREKNVGLILWVVWKTLEDQLEPALDQSTRSGGSRG